MGITNNKKEVTVNNGKNKGADIMTTSKMMQLLTENGYVFNRPLTDAEIKAEFAKVADVIATATNKTTTTTTVTKPDNNIVLTTKMVYQVAEGLLNIRTTSFNNYAISKSELYKVISKKVFEGYTPEEKLMGAINFLVHNGLLSFKVRRYGRIEFFKTFDDVVRDEYGNIIGFHMIPQINVETADR